MVQIVIILGIALFLTLILSKADKVGKGGLISILLFVILAIGGSIYLETENDRYSENMKRLVLDYNSDKNISCGEYTVNQKDFNLASNSFVAKKGKFGGVIISVEECFEK
ncbi:hypothetical protein ThvES_00003230 [Thiovulum sp. ES]|nr:hypothetical protein ThvES_00003230 [Thiovulum sp. ES]